MLRGQFAKHPAINAKMTEFDQLVKQIEEEHAAAAVTEQAANI